jgi:septal ring factor EnvC (AmiA/AmiB activator)
MNSTSAMNPSSQLSTAHAEKKDLERSKAAAAEARKAMQVALKTWEKGNEKKKSRADYQAWVKQHLETMEKDLESSIAYIIEQRIAPQTKMVSYYADTRYD